ncbi:TPA: DUF2325 domain-containing protein, partial [Clostridioides difficile]|nr:DUF2325 domain-containing protein [Clostridioides difficile]
AKKKGYKTKVYTTMSSKLNNSIGRPDAVVILTSTVSHKMSRTVESQAKKQDILIVRHKNSSKVAFNECLDMVDECLGNCSKCKLKDKQKQKNI